MSSIERILIVGAKGQVGAELVEREWGVGTFVLPATRDQVDLVDRDAVVTYLEEWRPDVVVNAAAYTAVDRAEEQPELAYQVNHRGVVNLVDGCRSIGAKLIHLSTDYVFDGTFDGWYREGHGVNPLGVYGRSKRAGELAALQLPEAVVIRTSWIYSSRGANFVRTMLRLGRERDTIGVVDDQRGCPTSAADVADAIVRVIDNECRHTGVFHVAAPDDGTWWDVANEVLLLDERRSLVQLDRLTTAQYPTPARRPADSRLSSEAFEVAYGLKLRPWRTALADVMDQLSRQAPPLAVPLGGIPR